MKGRVLVRGGGDLASGVALRLHRAGLRVVLTELPEPQAVRRTVSFCEAVYAGEIKVEEATARCVTRTDIAAVIERGDIPVVVDPEAQLLTDRDYLVVVDGRMRKEAPRGLSRSVSLLIGLGPGFNAGQNCDAAVETRRSHTLGRVFWDGLTQKDSGQPEGDPRRVLRAPADGALATRAEIADVLEDGQPIAEVGGRIIRAPFAGVLRGLLRPGLQVRRGAKIGDVDPRGDPAACYLVSDKALAIGGGVLEAICARPELRAALWG